MLTAISIRLQLFGRFGASTLEPHPRLIQIAGSRRRALLSYLAMQANYSETRERLATFLWGDRFDKQARQNLRQTLAALRKELEPIDPDLLRIDRDSVGLDPSQIVVDVREFLAAAQSDDLERAVQLYTGPFLDGLDLEGEAFTDWVRSESAKVASAATRVFERYAGREDAAGRGLQAISTAERLVSLDPLREASQRLLLRLLARYRGRDAARALATAFVRMLRQDLDAAPEPATTALIAAIDRNEIELATAMRAARAPESQAIDIKPASGISSREDSSPAAPTASDAGRAPRWRPAWLPRSKVVVWSTVAAALTIVVAAVAGSQFLRRPAHVNAGETAMFDGNWTGTIACDKLSFTNNPMKTTLALAVSQGAASFTRPVYDPVTNRVAGYETGKGTVATNGAISLSSIWPYPTTRTYTASYGGVLSGNHGELKGTQIFRYDGKTEERNCAIVVDR